MRRMFYVCISLICSLYEKLRGISSVLMLNHKIVPYHFFDTTALFRLLSDQLFKLEAKL